jgi:hypothetical protein
MNEQIKQLMLEARLGPALLLHHWGKIDALTDSEQAELERLEKFAELIVKECIEIVDKWSYDGPYREEGDIIPVKKIKEHFRVEE